MQKKREKEERTNVINKKITHVVNINLTTQIITLNVSGLSTAIKREIFRVG